jgi:hypothetical protein
MDYFSAIKNNKMILFTDKWMEVESIMLIEVGQVQKEKGHIFNFICGS